MRKVSVLALQRALQYGEPAGEARLRRALAQYWSTSASAAGADEDRHHRGATHALDIVTRIAAKARRSVLVDEPGWSVEYAPAGGAGHAGAAGAARPDPEGPGSGGDAAPRQARSRKGARPRLYVTVSVLHNPTGHR